MDEIIYTDIKKEFETFRIYQNSAFNKISLLENSIKNLKKSNEDLNDKVNFYIDFLKWYHKKTIFKKIIWRLKNYNINKLLNLFENEI